jgi:L-amino acid N-acyltransferase YncA
MNEAIIIRPFQPTGSGYAGVAEVAAQFPRSQLCDFEYATAPELRAFDAWFAGGSPPLRRYVAVVQNTGLVAGYGHSFPMLWSPAPRAFWMAVRVRPGYALRGIGGRLYSVLHGDLKRQGAALAHVAVRETQPAIIAAAERHGFRETVRTWPFSLDPAAVDLGRFQGALKRAAGHGIAIETLAERRVRDSDWLARLCELHAAVMADVPLPEHPVLRPAPEWLARFVAGPPPALPEAFFIALDGERYVGESFVQRDEYDPDALQQKVTGVLTTHRGRGIAQALKLATIAYAQRSGAREIRTWVESSNAPMLAINQGLGFTQGPGVVVLAQRPLRFEFRLALRPLLPRLQREDPDDPGRHTPTDREPRRPRSPGFCATAPAGGAAHAGAAGAAHADRGRARAGRRRSGRASRPGVDHTASFALVPLCGRRERAGCVCRSASADRP